MAVVLTVSRNFNVGRYSDIFEPIWFKLDITIDTTELYTLIPVHMASI